MENKQPINREVATDKRKAYRKPQLVEYGQVGGLTQSGQPSYTGENGIYTLFSN